MLVGAGQEIGLGPQQSLATRNRVAGYCRVRVTDMRPRINVINRGRDVEFFCHEIVVGRSSLASSKSSTTKDTKYHKGKLGKHYFTSWILVSCGLLLFRLQVFLHCFLHHQLQWYTVLGGDAAAVLIFGSVAGHGTVQACDLNPHVAKAGWNG